MSVLSWMMDMIRGREPPPESVRAKELAASISAQADRLDEALSPYKQARDPFAAMMADMYNRDQVERIWHGPRHD